MKSLFGRHRVRATFFHAGASIVLVATVLAMLSVITPLTCSIITGILFWVDYAAEMYDPHPDKPGPWFKAHFHRFLEDDND